MLNKKIHSLVLAGIMLISISLAIIPTTNASSSSPLSIKGILYNLDDEIAGAGIEIKLVFTDGTETTSTYDYNLYGDDTNYNLGFWGHEDLTGSFTVVYGGNDLIPVDNATIDIDPLIIGYEIDLHVDLGDIPEPDTELPSKVTGLSVSDAKDGKLNLEWDAATDNVAVDHYNIYRAGTFLTTTTGITYQDTGLTNGQEYCYQISAVDTSDLEGEKSDEDCATPTETYTPPGPGPGPGPSPPSGDDDDDTPTGDDDDDDEVIPNNPPKIVNFTGDLIGTQNVEYNYSALATDLDGHDVSYTFYWADASKNVTDFVTENTTYNIAHTWTAAGVYNINVNAIDDYDNGNGTPSGNTSLQVLIDAHIIDNGDVDGYLTDNDSDGTYDNFHNNEDGSDSGVGTEGSLYLLDTDGDGEYDYKYDPNTGLGETIQDDTQDEPSGDTEPTGEDNTLLYVGAALIIIILLLLFFLATRKKDKK